jgi:proteic killer suppression protein
MGLVDEGYETQAMEVEFDDADLGRIEAEAGFNAGYSLAIVRAFKKVLNFIRAAADERDFRTMRSLNFERLKGNRQHQHSLRLNRQWRLVIEIKEGNPKNVIVVVGIEDYHR